MYGPDYLALTSDQLRMFRRIYIRDLWDGAVGLSRYNQANKVNFFSDDDLLDIEATTRSDWAEELDSQWIDKKRQRQSAGDFTVDAESAALRAQTDSRFRLLRAECLSRMMSDPAMQASFIVGKSDLGQKVFESWAKLIEADRSWARLRAGEFAMIQIQRM